MPVPNITGWNPAATAYRLRRRRRRIFLLWLLLGVAILSIVWDHAHTPATGWDDWTALNAKTFPFVSADAPNIISVRAGDSVTPIRLLGVAPAGEPWDSRAKLFLTSLLNGKSVTVRLEPTQPRDEQSRLPGYVYLTDQDMINANIIRAGLAKAERKAGYAFRTEISAAESEARRKHLGLWAIPSAMLLP